MQDWTAARLALARRVSPGYAGNLKVAAVIAAGSVGRGWADRFSDLELDVYWRVSPTDDDRMAPIRRVGGAVKFFWPYSEDEEEWAEEYFVDGVKIGISSFLVDTIERFLVDVVDGGDPSPLKQMRLAAIQYSVVLSGDALVHSWRQKASNYPDSLAEAMVRRFLDPDRFAGWPARQALIEREDMLALYELFVRAARSIVGTLLGLNRVYLAHPSFKWLTETTEQMEFAPVALAQRLKRALAAGPAHGAAELDHLLAETLALVKEHAPTLDVEAVEEAITAERLPSS